MSEVLYTSEISGQLWNICARDLATGTCLATYNGLNSAPHSLSLIGNSYLISAVNNKSLLHIWLLQKREQIHQRMVVSGTVSALAVSPDGLYCVAAVNQIIHIWQISTGHLLAVLDKHYQDVTCLRFTDDGSHFISGGADNLVLAWSFCSVVSLTDDTSGKNDPRYTWSDHSLPISDVYVGHGALRSRIFTASLDHTCKVYELCSGQLLTSLVFDSAVTSVIVDATETRLYAGASNGNIYQVNLFDNPTRAERYSMDEKDPEIPVFRAHTKAVTCLALSLDGSTLASGSQDGTARLWHVASRQCTRTIQHKGAVTNLLLSHVRPTLAEGPGAKYLPPVSVFKRSLYGAVETTDGDDGIILAKLSSRNRLSEETEVEQLTIEDYLELCATQVANRTDTKKIELLAEVERLRAANKHLLQTSVAKTLQLH